MYPHVRHYLNILKVFKIVQDFFSVVIMCSALNDFDDVVFYFIDNSVVVVNAAAVIA